MKEIPTLETERLTLRPFTLDDASDVQRLAGDPAIADMTLNIPHPYKDGMAEGWISKHQEAFDKGDQVTLAITRTEDGTLLGAISLVAIAAGHQAEMGYWVGKPYWGDGCCTEAARAVTWYAFTDLNLIRVHARHITRNPASGRVMQKIGMKHEGSQRLHVKKGDALEGMELYGILKDEWNEE